jgi:uncharacterized protein (TIGR03435 family)
LRKLAGGIFTAAVFAAALHAQSAIRPAFEVASVKQNPNDVPEGISLQPNGGVRFTGFRLRTLIMIAYGSPGIARFDQLIGGPSWLAVDRFDIVAKAGGDISADAQGRRSDRLPLMLQTLLEDRFSLRLHQETRRMPCFALMLARRDGRLGPQIHASSVECPRFVTAAPLPKVDPDKWCGIRALGGTITGRGVQMSQIAGNLSGYPEIDRFVTDRTALTGRYDFTINYSSAADGPSLFTALSEQLGLALHAETADLPVLVVDNVAHPSTD